MIDDDVLENMYKAHLIEYIKRLLLVINYSPFSLTPYIRLDILFLICTKNLSHHKLTALYPLSNISLKWSKAACPDVATTTSLASK